MISDAASVRAAGQWLQAHAPAGAQLCADSRALQAGDVFIALPGRRTDGRRYLVEAASRGASAALVEERGWSAGDGPAGLPVLPVAGLDRAAGWIASLHYGDPTARLRTIGITGTNGKTSSCHWIARVLGECGERCAVLGTLGFGFPGALDTAASDLTTPDAVSVQRLARRALDEGARAFALEASSIGLDQGRLDAVSFELAVFTNLTRDHLDYHGDMAAYGAAKRRLFDWPTLAHAVINLDDPFGHELAAALARAGRRVTGVQAAAATPAIPNLACRLRAARVEHLAKGMRIDVLCERANGSERALVETAVIGEFNVLNLLGVLGTALACGMGLTPAATALGRLPPPPGRLQRVLPGAAAGSADAPAVIVDYAHTPDAIAAALGALRPLARARGGRLWIVFGAGGDRDRDKRGPMGAAASMADRIVLTSDNPRGEDPARIADAIAAGVPDQSRVTIELDRRAAIRSAILDAGPRDVVLVAGKGHEKEQLVAGRSVAFDDAAEARTALAEYPAG